MSAIYARRYEAVFLCSHARGPHLSSQLQPKRNPSLWLREPIAKLAEKGLHVSINTIRRRLAEAKVEYRPTRQKPLLSEVHMEKRLTWATENVDRDWSNVQYFLRTKRPSGHGFP